MSRPVIADIRYSTSALPNSIASIYNAVVKAGFSEVLAEGIFSFEPPNIVSFYMVPPNDPEYMLLKGMSNYQDWSTTTEHRLPLPDTLNEVWYDLGGIAGFRRLWLVCDALEGDWPMLQKLIKMDCRGYENRITLILPAFAKKPETDLDICCPAAGCRVRLTLNSASRNPIWNFLWGKQILDLEEGGDFNLKKIL